MAGRHAPSTAAGTAAALTAIVPILAAATVLGLIALWPSGAAVRELPDLGFVRTTYPALVTSVRIGPCTGSTPEFTSECRLVRAMLLAGPDRGEPFELEFSTTGPIPEFAAGDRLTLGFQPNALPQFRYIYLDRDRKPTLAWLALVFAAAVVALGRWRGVAALAGLVASFVVLLMFIIPAILDGSDPLLVAVVGSSAIAFLALYLAHGFGTRTTVALLGTLASLGLAALVGTLFVRAAAFTGLATEEAFIVRLGAENVDLAGLLLAGLIIGALGAIDDMAVTQASSVWELRAANPTSSRRELLRASTRIGQDHVSSTVNTLALAYAGASLPLLILFLISRQSLGTVANSEIVAAEIVRTLVGGIALVACVPFTTWLAVLAVPKEPGADTPGDLPRV